MCSAAIRLRELLWVLVLHIRSGFLSSFLSQYFDNFTSFTKIDGRGEELSLTLLLTVTEGKSCLQSLEGTETVF